jgi:hypothetical protein
MTCGGMTVGGGGQLSAHKNFSSASPVLVHPVKPRFYRSKICASFSFNPIPSSLPLPCQNRVPSSDANQRRLCLDRRCGSEARGAAAGRGARRAMTSNLRLDLEHRQENTNRLDAACVVGGSSLVLNRGAAASP